MKTFKEIREGFVSAAQRKAVWASRADGGKGHPDNKKKSKKEDAVADYLAKGGKIKKLPPAKAQGYHGKDDPGKGMAGMMDKGDTKGLPRKKVKSMGEAKQTHMFDNEKDARAKAKEIGGKYVKGTGKSVGKHAAIREKQVNELSPATHSSYQKAAAKSAAKGAAKFGAGKMSADDALANQKKRQKGIDTSKYLNRMQHGVKESAEVNELDTNTLISYRKKANKQRYSNDTSKRAQRTKGVDRADKKLTKRGIDKFDNKTMNELSPATKKSYINKAASDIDNRSYAQGTVDATNKKYDGKNNMKIANRLKGIRRATK